jgi:hypothetical protein
MRRIVKFDPSPYGSPLHCKNWKKRNEGKMNKEIRKRSQL